jgi:hypothetical protein
MSNLQTSEVLYRIVLNPEHSLVYSTYAEAADSWQSELLAGHSPLKFEVLTNTDWVAINDPCICRWCKQPYGTEPHIQCQIEEDQDYRDFCDYRTAVRMDLHF